ncbi:hypothetical protein QR680_015821 [Steinernema hermaphroditum]|uniref:G-protein coupled receptors family 1 profile domain-containing protein n=1 Tax=Steinernema hermaphroditum TaxID=289476 RepID=A0AA39HB75_9BILA|nr:hypothetical protein QR680_015821 [Steinernema hermaphroditum]
MFTSMFLYKHNLIAGLLLEFAGLLGFAINYYILFRIIGARIFGRKLGYIWMSREMAHCFASTMFIAFIGPVSLWNPSIFEEFMAQQILHLIYLFKSAVYFTNLLIAVNRAVMVLSPLQYKTMFDYSRTILYITCTWIASVCAALPNVINPCQQTSLNSSVSYYAHRDECSRYIHLFDVLYAPVLFLITVVINMAVLWKLYRLPEQRKELSLCTAKKSNELRLSYMIMAEVTSALLMICIQRFGFLFKDELVSFMLTTFTWSIASAFDGLIVVIFNAGLRSVLSRDSYRPRTASTFSSFYVKSRSSQSSHVSHVREAVSRV